MQRHRENQAKNKLRQRALAPTSAAVLLRRRHRATTCQHAPAPSHVYAPHICRCLSERPADQHRLSRRCSRVKTGDESADVLRGRAAVSHPSPGGALGAVAAALGVPQVVADGHKTEEVCVCFASKCGWLCV